MPHILLPHGLFYRNEYAGFRHIVEKLEQSPKCQRLPLRSFLILPFQRITRLKLLVQVLNPFKSHPASVILCVIASLILVSLETAHCNKLIQ